MMFESTADDLISATRSPTQMWFISRAGCAHTLALYGAMKVSVSAAPNLAIKKSSKLRGGGGRGRASFCVKSVMIFITSGSGSRHTLACTGYPTHVLRMRAGE